MNSAEAIKALDLTAKLMELHGENPFKTKALASAAYRLSKLRYDFTGKSAEEIAAMEGVGKSIANTINSLLTNNNAPDLERLLEITPPGVADLLRIKGLGPKKVRQLWQELEIENAQDLLYACNENRLVTLKGFGSKTQTQVQQALEFRQNSAGKFLYAAVAGPVFSLAEELNRSGMRAAVVGQLARRNEVIDKIDLLVQRGSGEAVRELTASLPLPVNVHEAEADDFVLQEVMLSASDNHVEKAGLKTLSGRRFGNAQEVYAALHMQFIPAELREGADESDLATKKAIPRLLELSDLKGILHNHTTYSDGIHTVKEMADYCRDQGFQYLGICDHSKSAFYANGLTEERIVQQHREIDALNAEYTSFRILKGIESDILSDGGLDYTDDILSTFDFIVASVHSNLKMDEQKATARLLRAIENPFTDILGHPTGRLLLGRPGYPVDHRKVIDACAANGVCIELNANPYRLDIDWRWIRYCVEKGVMIGINPDAHHTAGLHDIEYGVLVARKGMLDAAHCLNALGLPELEAWLRKRRA